MKTNTEKYPQANNISLFSKKNNFNKKIFNNVILIDNSLKGCIRMAKIQAQEVITFIEERCEENNIQNNIYMAQITKIDYGNNSIFLEYENGKICFLNQKDLLSPFSEEECSNRRKKKFKVGDFLIVQITREQHNEKYPKCSTKIFMQGIYCNVYKSQDPRIEFQNNDYENIQLPRICVRAFEKYGYTLVIKSTKNKQSLWKEIMFLKQTIVNIEKSNKKKNGLLYFNLNIQRMFNYILDDGVEKIIVAGEKLFKQMKSIEFLFNSDQKENIFLYSGQYNIFSYYDFMEKIIEITNNNVISYRGISIVTNRTSACTTIDVNWKGLKSNNGEKINSILEANKIAAYMILKSIGQKNIGGMVFTDFINMNKTDSMQELTKYIKDNAIRLNIKLHVAYLNKPGIIILTLPYNKYDLFNNQYEVCEKCGGNGLVKRKIVQIFDYFNENLHKFDENIPEDIKNLFFSTYKNYYEEFFMKMLKNYLINK